MADVRKLLEAAIQAVDAGAADLAADFVGRALRELRPVRAEEAPVGLPWSTDPRDERFGEFLRRAIGFLERFEAAPEGRVPEDQARLFAREFFGEEPRVVGPSFYRPGYLQGEEGGEGNWVLLTAGGRRTLSRMRKYALRLEKGAGVY